MSNNAKNILHKPIQVTVTTHVKYTYGSLMIISHQHVQCVDHN